MEFECSDKTRFVHRSVSRRSRFPCRRNYSTILSSSCTREKLHNSNDMSYWICQSGEVLCFNDLSRVAKYAFERTLPDLLENMEFLRESCNDEFECLAELLENLSLEDGVGQSLLQNIVPKTLRHPLLDTVLRCRKPRAMFFFVIENSDRGLYDAVTLERISCRFNFTAFIMSDALISEGRLFAGDAKSATSSIFDLSSGIQALPESEIKRVTSQTGEIFVYSSTKIFLLEVTGETGNCLVKLLLTVPLSKSICLSKRTDGRLVFARESSLKVVSALTSISPPKQTITRRVSRYSHLMTDGDSESEISLDKTHYLDLETYRSSPLKPGASNGHNKCSNGFFCRYP